MNHLLIFPFVCIEWERNDFEETRQWLCRADESCTVHHVFLVGRSSFVEMMPDANGNCLVLGLNVAFFLSVWNKIEFPLR